MNCNYCKHICVKKGRRKSGGQTYRCTNCRKYQQDYYCNKAWKVNCNRKIIRCLKHGVGIRGTAAIAEISTSTVMTRIKRLSEKVEKPVVIMNKIYEMDELKTYVTKKNNEKWIIYAIDKETRQVVDFRIGKRNKRNLGAVIDTLIFSNAKRIYTDKLILYKNLIPKQIHKAVAHSTNYIERKNLNLRTHIKRLSRKTICFSKSVTMLTAIVKLYFWT
jgi:insertion element IS1 protein InsB